MDLKLIYNNKFFYFCDLLTFKKKSMKNNANYKFLFILIVFLQPVIIFSQTISLDFIAVYESTEIEIDSIQLINITRNSTDVIHYPQTSYVLVSTSNIENISNKPTGKIFLSEAYPNPFNDITNTNLHSNIKYIIFVPKFKIWEK